MRAFERAPAGPVQVTLAGAPPVTLDLPAGRVKRGQLLAALSPYQEPVFGQVVAGSPAARAGMRSGDRVTTADGMPVRSWQQLVGAIRSHPGKPLALGVERAGQPLTFTVTPNGETEQNADGNSVKVGKVGAGPQPLHTVHSRVGVFEAVGMGAEQTAAGVSLIGGVLKQLVTGQISARNMGGILSIGQASGETAKLGFDVWLAFLALFSVNLAVLNLLPIPILDGGHLMFLAFEAVRGRPLSVEARIRLSQVGLVIVVALMIWANGNDVVRLVFGR